MVLIQLSKYWRLALLGLLLLGSSLAAQSPVPSAGLGLDLHTTETFARPRIAIIIDDIGYHQLAGERAIALPGAVTLAVLPFSPRARELARAAKAAGKQVILHVPMEPHNQVPWETGGLSANLDVAARELALERMLAAVPEVVGINNHMGSKFTEDPVAMQWLMGQLQARQFFFVDSRTTPASKGWSSAQALGLPSSQRDIFLDNEPDPDAIHAQLEKLVRLAQRRGHAVAIAHPRPTTLEVLEQQLPQLQDRIELVPVSRLLTPAWAGLDTKAPSED